MAYEPKDNSGSLFKNDKKQPNHPDYKGSCIVDGVEYWMSAWIKPTKDGTGRWMSFAFQAKQDKPKQQARPARGGFDDMQDDLPPF